MAGKETLDAVEQICKFMIKDEAVLKLSVFERLEALGIVATWIVMGGDKEEVVRRLTPMISAAIEDIVQYFNEAHQVAEYPTAIDLIITSSLLARLATICEQIRREDNANTASASGENGKGNEARHDS